MRRLPLEGMGNVGVIAMKAPRPGRRGEILTAARNYKMATSAHAYVRGNTTQFYEWLASVAASSFPQSPQNRCPAGFSPPQREHRIAVSSVVVDG